MINEVDITLLFEKPEFNNKAILWITPLAPLSMVISMPGAFYRSQPEPSFFMLLGMIENMLGWHFSDEIRRKILKQIKKKSKGIDIMENSSEVGFVPLLQTHFQVQMPALYKSQCTFFYDYWTQHLKDVDERHAKGNRNYDYSLEKEVELIYKEPDDKTRNKLWQSLFKNKTDKFPAYYQSPTRREFVLYSEKIGYKVRTNQKLLEMLTQKSENSNSPLYLGSNEGWIDIKIQKL